MEARTDSDRQGSMASQADRSIGRKVASQLPSTSSLFRRPDSRTRGHGDLRPSQLGEGASMGSRSKLLSSAMALSSIVLLRECRLGGSFTSSQRKGMARM